LARRWEFLPSEYMFNKGFVGGGALLQGSSGLGVR
jgi:hypothetical protein